MRARIRAEAFTHEGVQSWIWIWRLHGGSRTWSGASFSWSGALAQLGEVWRDVAPDGSGFWWRDT